MEIELAKPPIILSKITEISLHSPFDSRLLETQLLDFSGVSPHPHDVPEKKQNLSSLLKEKDTPVEAKVIAISKAIKELGESETVKQVGISDIFFYFQQYTTLENGRTFGRKLGVVQEVIIRKFLELSPVITSRLYFERVLVGISGAGHKVEFAIYPIVARRSLHSPGRTSYKDLDLVVYHDAPTKVGAPVSILVNKKEITILRGKPLPTPLRETLNVQMLDLRVNFEDGVFYLDVISTETPIISVESKRVGAQRFSGSDKLGAGIQTIEKAKQTSLVAIDLDLKANGTIKYLAEEIERKSISIVVLGNGVHWDEKDRSVFRTFVDYAFLMPDSVMIRYADFIKEIAQKHGGDFVAYFRSHFPGMTKMVSDEFQVTKSDLNCLEPRGEQRGLHEVIQDHILKVNPIRPQKP
jgi:hypothetical protein